MLLCITFENELLPFILDMATEEECLKAIEKAKEDFMFDKADYIVTPDRIILHAFKKRKIPRKRLYCLKDKIILQTDANYSNEIQSTKELLAYEKNVAVDEIFAIEI